MPSINGTEPGKATETDKINNDFYKTLPNNWFPYLLNMFNKIRQEEETPSSCSQIQLYHAVQESCISDPLNYRVIALINSIFKFNTKIITLCI